MQSNNTSFNCPIFISKLSNHIEIKNKLLSLISDSPTQTINNNSDNIEKTDFYIDNDRDYKQFLLPYLTVHMKEVFRPLNISGFEFGNMWFQQYIQDNTHDWHIHGKCHWTNVYFVELIDPLEKTQVSNIYNKEQINYNIEEGSILTFPSFLYHKSPSIQSGNRKTIVSFNLNFL
jgi:hypothetical protein